MRSRKVAQRVAVLAALPVLGLSLAGTASASSAGAENADYVVSNTNACVATEQIRVWSDGHDRMQLDPNRNDSTCWFGIWNNATSSWVYGPTQSGGLSGWYWDGPDTSLMVGVYSTATGHWNWGPSN
ncbi:hypothetical protein ACFZCP_38395 [Streptomyces sp. NPDC007971]|uniref:hypothetical protein n=1 Tax=Streptomyces sp. NPDC007971 TaxID=3364799 RepID=UPI0036EA4CD4